MRSLFSVSNLLNTAKKAGVSQTAINNALKSVGTKNLAGVKPSDSINSALNKVVNNYLNSSQGLNNSPAEVINSQYNSSNALAQTSANDVNQFNKQMLENQQAFNSAEAEKNRMWQEEMSNTAHQREVADLQKAGLNPILSANGGATVGAGAVASSGLASGQKADVNFNQLSALASLYSAMKNTELTEEKIRQDYELGSRSLDVQEKLGMLSAENGLLGSYAMAGASRYAAEMSYNSTKYINDLNHPFLTLASELMSDGQMSSSQAFASAIKQITGGNNPVVNKLVNSVFGNDNRSTGSHTGGTDFVYNPNNEKGRGGQYSTLKNLPNTKDRPHKK